MEKLKDSAGAGAQFVSEKLLNGASKEDIAAWLKTWM